MSGNKHKAETVIMIKVNNVNINKKQTAPKTEHLYQNWRNLNKNLATFVLHVLVPFFVHSRHFESNIITNPSSSLNWFPSLDAVM